MSNVFQFKPFSKKQRQVLNWWMQESPVHNKQGIIADGSIRSGKTLSMSLSFVIWAMDNFNNQNFAMCGKTIESFRRNVLNLLKVMLSSRGYVVAEKRTENLVVVSKGKKTNLFYIFGGRDERSQDLIQGLTLAGIFFDEVALMPESFVNQGTGRCSVTNSKLWFNCNPSSPKHWFKTEWVDKVDNKDLIYLHFTMDDNLSLTNEIKKRYRTMFNGVFFKRYVLGMWVNAEGVIYEYLANHLDEFMVSADDIKEIIKRKETYIDVGVDFGGNGSQHALTATMRYKDSLIVLKSKKYKALGTDAKDIVNIVDRFCKDVISKWGYIDRMYCDHMNMIVNSINNETNYIADLTEKPPINDRIYIENKLIGEHRIFFIENECDDLLDGMCEAVYDERASLKGKDVRKDTEATENDCIDSFEYSWVRYIEDYA